MAQFKVKKIEEIEKWERKPNFWDWLLIVILLAAILWLVVIQLRVEPSKDKKVYQPARLPSTEYAHNIYGELAKIADKNGISSKVLIKLADCESKFDPNAIGDGKFRSRGMFQISAFYNPKISDAQAFDWRWAANYTAQQIAKGKGKMWSCYRLNN